MVTKQVDVSLKRTLGRDGIGDESSQFGAADVDSVKPAPQGGEEVEARLELSRR